MNKTKAFLGDLEDEIMEFLQPLLREADAQSRGRRRAVDTSGIHDPSQKKIKSIDLQIDWSKSADQISRQVRVGGAFTTINGRRIKILSAQVIDGVPIDTQPGQVCEVDTKYCCVATGEKALSLIEVQPEGKSAMKIEEWLNGARLNIESLLGV